MGLKRTGADHTSADLPIVSTRAERIAALADIDPDIRRTAALELAGDTESTALDALLATIAVEQDRSAREAMATTLARTDDGDVATRLALLLHSDDASLRSTVVDALTQMPTGMSTVMDSLIGSDDADIRILAVMVLGNVHHPRVPAWLAELVEHDPHANVVSAAISELAVVGNSSHIELVRAAARRFPDDGFLTFSAAQAANALAGAGSS